MEKRRTEHTALRAASDPRKNRWAACVAVLCLVMGASLVIGMALLGDCLLRFADVDTNVIPLVTPEEDAPSPTAPSKAENPATPTKASPELKGGLQVFDEERFWSSETQVDLFRSSYDGTAVSRDGEKIIAPGTSNYYGFALKNNGDIPLDYTVSLKVEALGEEQETAIPLEWRLLEGDGTAVSDWQEYADGRTEELKRSKLPVRRQDSYTIEWRWDYDQDPESDRTDTILGNLAEDRLLGAKATILVNARQSADWDGKPPIHWGLPQTGDTFNMALYLAVLVLSGCALALLFAVRRKKDKHDKQEE